MADSSSPLAWSLLLPTAIVLAAGTLTASAAAPEKPSGPVITPSLETTHFLGPLDSAGYVDFVAALNRELGRGVDAAENAAIPLLQAMGPCEGSADTVNLVLEELGAKPWSPGMLDFQSQGEYLKTANTGDAAKFNTQFNAQYDAAMSTPWQKADHPDIAALLALNEKPLAALSLAVQKPKYYRPIVLSKPDASLIMALLPDIQSYRDVARQLKMRAMLHLGEGRPADAQQDLLAMHRLGRCVGQGGTLIESLVGIAIDAIAGAGDNVWAAHPDLTPEQIAAYRLQLAALPPVTDMVRGVETTERAMCLDVTQAVARGRIGNSANEFRSVFGLAQSGEFENGSLIDTSQLTKALVVMSVDWNVVMRTINGQYDDLVQAARQPDRARRAAMLDGFENDLKRMKSETTSFKTIASSLVGGSTSRGKTFGNVLATLLFPAVRQALTAQDIAQARGDLLQVMLALAEYHQREGKFPESLSALSPKYLPSVPNDLFAGGPFRYSSDGSSYRLYSIGRNERDDGGLIGSASGADDVLMAYPPPAR